MNEYFFSERGIYYRTNIFRVGIPILVFVHGLSGSSSAWKRYETAFEDTYNVLSLDLRGHGKSVKPSGSHEYQLRHFVGDLRDLLDHLGIKQCILISHSFGTLITLEFLLTYQNRVQAAVFLSPNITIARRWSARLIQPLVWLGMRIFEYIPIFSRTGTHIDYDRYRNTGDWNVRRMFADVRNTGVRIYLYCLYHSYAFDREDSLEKIAVPVLIMHGKNDTIFPVENAIIAARRIKHSTLVLLDDADHILVLNHFPEVSAALSDFFK